MNPVRREFAGPADTAELATLTAAYPAVSIHVVDLPYRFSSWALDDPANGAVWEDRGQVVAWAVLQTPFWALDYWYLPAAEYLLSEILAWANQRGQRIANGPFGRPTWFLHIRGDQPWQLQATQEAGYTRQDTVAVNPWSKVWLRRSGPTPQPSALPAGYRVRPLAGASEAAAYAECHRAAFGSVSMTEQWRARTLQASGYTPELDLVVEAPDGHLAAFCIAWLGHLADYDQPVGQIEPLGVHPDDQRRGLGRVILDEALRRLGQHSAGAVYVESDDDGGAAYQLYHAAGFRVVTPILVCRRDLDGPIPR